MCIPENLWFGFLLGGLISSSVWGIYWFYQHAWCRLCLGNTLVIVQKMIRRGAFVSFEDRAVIGFAIKYLMKHQ
jgi:hypothetical protein